MAFTNFYIQSGASDLNAGSTTAAAASLTYAGGTFVRATGVFTVASGNPVADGVVVDDWISIYTTAGATTTTFVGKCTARTATTITVSTTVVMGLATSVSEAAGATTAKVGGAWASEIVLAATGLGTFTVPASTKVNIKQATYTIVASRTISMAGTTAFPIWFSGYNTTPGDLDADITNSLAKPIFAFDAGLLFNSTGEYQIWSSLSVTGNRSGAFWQVTQSTVQILRCRSENTSSNAAAYAFDASGCFVAYCWFKTPITATTNGVIEISLTTHFLGSVFEGGGKAGVNMATQPCQFRQCIFLNNTGHGILATTGGIVAMECTFKSPTGDGIRWSGTPSAATVAKVTGCLFVQCGGYGINNASGANSANVHRACNDFYLNTSGDENGFGDSPAFFGQTDSSQVVTSATDMTPVVGSNARGKGFPSVFEGGGALGSQSNPGQNIGAVHEAAGGVAVLAGDGIGLVSG